MILTVAEIKDLAECAGLVLEKDVEFDEYELSTEICIEENKIVTGDDGISRQYNHIAYFHEYPEEGVYPLGDEVEL